MQQLLPLLKRSSVLAGLLLKFRPLSNLLSKPPATEMQYGKRGLIYFGLQSMDSKQGLSPKTKQQADKLICQRGVPRRESSVEKSIGHCDFLHDFQSVV